MFYHDGIGFRPVEERDLEKIRVLRNDPTTWAYLTDINHVTPEAQADWFRRIRMSKDKTYFTVFKEEYDPHVPIAYEGDFLGIIRMDEIDQANRSARIGADIDPACRGQGYGTKTYKALLKYCFDFLNMHRVWLCVLDSNEIGKRLYANAGFKVEGKYREAIFRDGTYHDYIVMSILESEYRRVDDDCP